MNPKVKITDPNQPARFIEMSFEQYVNFIKNQSTVLGMDISDKKDVAVLIHTFPKPHLPPQRRRP